MQRLLHFFSYHNAVPIVISILFIGSTGAYAATNPEAIYDATETVVSVDNTYIAHKDLTSYSPKVEISGVTEDGENFYVAYRLTSIDIVDSVWQDVVSSDTMTVAKGLLGQDKDLGLYVTEQLKQLVDRKLQYLKEVQEFERRAITQKVVATAYSGLVGKFLDDKTETLPGYVPVVTPPPEPVAYVQNDGETTEPAPVQGGEVAGASTVLPGGPGFPEIQILGPNPHEIPINSSFADLGVVATDDSGYIPTVKVFLDGTLIETRPVTVDTSKPSEWHIRYEATDTDGNTTAAERLVIVKNLFAPSLPSEDVATTTQPESPPEPKPESTTQASTTPPAVPEAQPDPTPEPSPEPTPEPQLEPDISESVQSATTTP